VVRTVYAALSLFDFTLIDADTNDMRFQCGGGFVFADDFARYCIDALAS
jgi:hypothetical protein